MECNCNNNNSNGGVIPWVRGNRLPLIICVYENVVTQEQVGDSTLTVNEMTRVPYVIQDNDTVTVIMKSGFRQVEMPFTTDGNKVMVTDNGELPTGAYTVEVTIERGDGARGRWQETRQVRIYENTSDAQLGEMYSIDADLFFYAKGDTGTGIADITNNPDGTLTITMTDGTSYTTEALKGDKGDKGDTGERGVSIVSFDVTGQTDVSVIYTVTFSDDTTQDISVPKGPQGDTGLTGNGISTTTLNSDYTLTIAYTDGTTYTTPSIRGAQGVQGVSVIGFTQTGETATNTMYNLVFSDGRTQSVAIPKGVKGDKGDTGNTGSQGPQGPMGDVAVITPEQQAAFTMYSETGQNTDGPMTQKAVTDELVITISTTAVIMPSTTVDGVMIDLTKNPAEWKSQSPRKLYFIPYTYKQGDYIVIAANGSYESSVAFLTSSNHVAGTEVDWAGNQSSWYVVAAGENNADNPKEIPSDCTYICFNGYYSTTNFTPSSVQIVNKQFVSDYAVEVNDHADNNTLLIDTLASECQDKDIEHSYNTEAFVGQWTSGSIGTTAAIRAHLKLPTIGYNRLKLVIPSDYYTQLSYVDSDNVLISTRILEWQNGTITVDIDGQYDIMLNIKYQSAGTTKITNNMLSGVMWGVTLYNDEGYEPAAPYSDLVASVGGDHIIGMNEFVQGSNNEYGEIISSNYRCITYQLYDVDANTVVTVNNNGQAHVMLTLDLNGNIESTTGWITANSSFTYTFSNAKKVQFVVSWNGGTSTTIVPDQVAVGITIHYKGRLGVLEESMGDSATTKANDSFCRFNKKISVYNPYKDHPQNQYKGQMHCHTTNSDGALAPASVVAKYVDAGFDFMTITDHNYITPNPSPNADIVWMGNSYEDTWNAAGHQHMNVWNCTEVINKVDIYTTTNTPQMLVNHYVKDGDSVLSYNHPEYPAVYASDATLAGLPVGISFVEIFNATIQTYIGEVSSLPTEANYGEMVTYNGTRYINTSTTKASPNWQATTAEANPDGNLDRGFRIMLDSGKKVFCDAVDDFHRGDEMVGVGYMKVFANSRTRQSIWNGLLMGSSYSSTGVTLNDVSFIDGVFKLDIANGDSAVTTFYGYGNEVLGTSNGTTAIYEVTGDEKYVRAMVEIDGKKAWTQPVWIIAVGEQYEF